MKPIPSSNAVSTYDICWLTRSRGNSYVASPATTIYDMMGVHAYHHRLLVFRAFQFDLLHLFEARSDVFFASVEAFVLVAKIIHFCRLSPLRLCFFACMKI